MKQDITVLVGADICPIEGNLAYFKAGDAQSLFHDLLEEFANADTVVANLECPLIETPAPIVKTGPTFGEDPACINGIREAGIDVLCLANNHIMDHGPSGLRSTLAVCARAGVETVGAGENLGAARRILIRRHDGVRVGFLAMAEQEFSIATADSWGAQPLDVIDFVRNVAANRSNFDYLIVLLHGSAEFHVPTPRLQNVCRFLIEMGANAVIVQHPHCLGGYEEYRSGHIVYGQGALVMDEGLYRNLKSFHEGYLAKILIASDASSRLEIIPFVQSDPVPGAHKIRGADAERFVQSLSAKSRATSDPRLVEAEWQRFCQEREHGYLSAVLGHGRVLRRLNARGGVEKVLYSHRRLAGVRNMVRCETHREALETIFRNRGL